jgi:hypothetical protein
MAAILYRARGLSRPAQDLPVGSCETEAVPGSPGTASRPGNECGITHRGLRREVFGVPPAPYAIRKYS